MSIIGIINWKVDSSSYKYFFTSYLLNIFSPPPNIPAYIKMANLPVLIPHKVWTFLIKIVTTETCLDIYVKNTTLMVKK